MPLAANCKAYYQYCPIYISLFRLIGQHHVQPWPHLHNAFQYLFISRCFTFQFYTTQEGIGIASPMASARGRGRGRRGRGGEALLPTITWPGPFGPTEYDQPLDIFPVEGQAYYAPPNSLRPYDERKDEWPVCHHHEPCLVQLYDGYGDGGRRFFRCPYGAVSNATTFFLSLFVCMPKI